MTTDLKEKLLEACDEIVDITNTTIKFTNCNFEEAFPVTSYKPVEVDDIEYSMQINVTVKKYTED